MSKLMELVDDYGILRYRLACIGERNRASLAARADERKAEIRAAVAELERDAARYRWLRERSWQDSAMCVATRPKSNIKIGTFCPSQERLDEMIDAAMEAANVPE